MRSNLLIVALCLVAGLAFGGMEFDGVNDSVIYSDISAFTNDTQGSIALTLKIPDADDNAEHSVFWWGNTGSGNTYLQMKVSFLDAPLRDWIQIVCVVDGASKFNFNSGQNSIDGWLGKTLDVVLSQDGTSLVLYVDGVSVGTSAGGGDETVWMKDMADATTPINSMWLATNYALSQYYNSDVYRLQYYPVGLTVDDVSGKRNAYGWYAPNDGTNVIPPTLDTTGAIGYQDGDVIPDSTTVPDLSGSGVDGLTDNGVTQTTGQVPVDEVFVKDQAGIGVLATNEGATIAKTAGDWSAEFTAKDQQILVPDADDLSFTDGSDNDRPGSVAIWCNISDFTPDGASPTALFTKSDATFEYQFLVHPGVSDQVWWFGWDDSAGAYVGRLSANGFLNSYVNSNICLIATYSGNEANSGWKMYIDAVRFDSGDLTAGAYAGMENTSNPTTVGDYATSRVAPLGHYYRMVVFSNELSAVDATNIVAGGSQQDLSAYDVIRDFTFDPFTKPTSTDRPTRRR